ncbi:hypothetical protein AC579_4219 [Pseudocercospora musae]|uniref:Proline dehydrogenase n=1 Tax=Pseudocercospora musae TaxID=113226 RepID=A0A139ID39_9PEZI|nr:hypothetical protein AC579_4219 [Pseudocercospora musae]
MGEEIPRPQTSRDSGKLERFIDDPDWRKDLLSCIGASHNDGSVPSTSASAKTAYATNQHACIAVSFYRRHTGLRMNDELKSDFSAAGTGSEWYMYLKERDDADGSDKYTSFSLSSVSLTYSQNNYTPFARHAMATAMRSTRALRAEALSAERAAARHTPRTCRATPSTTQRRQQSTKRRLHSTSQNEHAAPLSIPTAPESTFSCAERAPTMAPLSALPISQILRSYLITTMSSHPTLFSASTGLLRQMLESPNPLLNLRNPLMRAVLWETFYKQFCAGENQAQVSQRCEEIRRLGYSGVILEYAKEVLKDGKTDELQDVAIWRKGMLETISIAAEGDFCALKWSGMGPAAMRRMAEEKAPSKEMDEAMHAITSAAAAKNISLLPSAEESWNLNGYQDWTLRMQRAYNTAGKSVVYNTYQMYLKDMPGRIAKHLEMAKAENFTLGAKLVRGAYLASEKRSLIHDTIQDTHNAYDSAASALLHRHYNSFLLPSTRRRGGREKIQDNINLMIASHNALTVSKARELRRQQKSRGEALTPLAFAQLQGMADEVSCALLLDNNIVREKVFKCTPWGSMQECLNYLLRRAAENQDAAGRTRETRRAMGEEIARRVRGGFLKPS